MKTVILLVLCIGILESVTAHICIISPHQRGEMNVTKGGDRTCFRHGAPCGGQPAGNPVATYPMNSPIVVHWQQNYNHYTVGHPGFMDIAWAHGPNPDDSDFHILGAIPDYNAHWQGSQRNFSLSLVTPPVVCDPCVFRVRYVAQKPGESTFYQCADVRIVDGNQVATDDTSEAYDMQIANQLQAERGPELPDRLYAVAFDEVTGRSEFVSVNPSSGSIMPKFAFPYAVHSVDRKNTFAAPDMPFVVDQVCAVDHEKEQLFMMASAKPLGSMPTELITIDIANSRFWNVTLSDIKTAINALTWDAKTGLLVAVSMQEHDASQGTFVTHIQTVNATTGEIKTLITTEPDDTFINFQWAELDTAHQLLYVLFQDENNAKNMNSILYTFDINKNSIVRRTALAYDRYTYESIQLDASGSLFAMSPGLVGGDSAWTAIAVDPISGNSKQVAPVAPGRIFLPYHGGAFFNGINKETNTLLYGLRHAFDPSSTIVAVNLANLRVTMSANVQLEHLHNVVRL